MRVWHVNASDISGGAARAAYRIHRALVEHGLAHNLTSQMRVIHKLSDDQTVIAGPPLNQSRLWRRLQPRLSRPAYKSFRSGNPVLHSVAWPATGLGAELQSRHAQGAADVIHLHWLGNSTLSVEEIGRLKAPLVWTLHDQWAFCGAEHYTTPPGSDETASSDERFTCSYNQASRPIHEKGFDLNRCTWLRKQRAWQQPMQIICPSNWLADCVRRSTLMGRWPIAVIPNPIDTVTWAPYNLAQARQLLNLPSDRPLILFGAMGGTTDSRKGADLLFEALQHLRQQVQDTDLAKLELVVFGQSQPVQPPQLAFPIHYAGRLQDDLSLRLLYAAADIFVIPSRQDNFPNTGIEAQACGTPVVAFRTGGLVDVIDDRITGALAEPFDPESLAQAIHWVLTEQTCQQKLREQARSRAERLWAPAIVAAAYAEVYQQASAL